MEKYVKKFSHIYKSDIALVGGKGANLGELSRLNDVIVPKGFSLTTEAFKEVVLDNKEISKMISSLNLNINDTKEINIKSDELRTTIEALTLPKEIQDEIKLYLLDMHPNATYAIRSSATAEDLPSASFAGQQDSYLNVPDLNSVFKSVLKCWASLYNERAVSYRIKNHFPQDKVSISVVIQEMVDSEIAGVLFTADPMTSDRFTMVIEAITGLGEELVAGRKKPASWTIQQEEIKQKVKGEAILTNEQLIELSKIGKRIQSAFNCEQDIEWCFSKGQFFIVQARPITTLYPTPHSSNGLKRCFVSLGHLQMMTDTVLPLGISMLQKSNFFSIKELGGHMYMDVTHDLANFHGRRALLSETKIKDTLIHDALLEIMKRKEYIKSIPKGPSSLTKVEGIFKLIAGAYKTYRRNNEADIDAYILRQKTEIEGLRSKIESLSGIEALQFIIDDQPRFRKVLYDPGGAGTAAVAILLASSIDKTIEKLTCEKTITNRLTKSVRHNVTSEMGLKLCEISDVVRHYPHVIDYFKKAHEDISLNKLRELNGGETIANKLEEFLLEYGMRCPGEIDITRKRFWERPDMLVSSILNNIQNLPEGYAILSFNQGKEEAEQLTNELVEKMKEKHGLKKANKLRKNIETYRKFVGVREYTKYFWMGHYDVYRKAVLKEITKLLENNILKNSDDANYLYLEELIDIIKSEHIDQDLIDRRKKDYAFYKTLMPPRIIFSDGEVPSIAYKNNIPENALAGLAVSSGIVEGRARVIQSLDEAQIEKGDILVTRFTDPSWTPLFTSLGGLVTEVGGMMSHGAVITREYGLPAVVGVVNATNLIHDGQHIRVNGTDGYIELFL